MKVAKVELGAKELELLRTGKPVVIRLPDAQVEISLSKNAQISDTFNDFFGKLQGAINRAKGRAA